MSDTAWMRKAAREVSGVKDKLRLSREERDHIAGHALDSIHGLAERLAQYTYSPGLAREEDKVAEASNAARKIAALSNLLGDIGWDRETPYSDDLALGTQVVSLGELFPVAQLRPWLEEWQRQDNEALRTAEEGLGVAQAEHGTGSDEAGRCVKSQMGAQTKLGTGAILLARIEKWMASHGN